MQSAERKTWRWIALAAAYFAALTALVQSHALHRFDYHTTFWLNSHGNRFMDWVMSLFTATATPELSMALCGALVIFLWWRFGWRPAACLLVAFVGGTMLEVVLKNCITQPGTRGLINRYVFGEGWIHITLPYAFPSGHALRAFLLIGVIALWVMPRAAVFWWALAGLASVSRLYLGHHWTTDVMGGALLATVLLMIIGTQIKPRETAAC
ncbi:MAG: phosphatase PAP2 family protein [Verrucomicrobia bacterium]|nr:phosphatase PAP2 family protein [Verrucomicrobiota bacterium]